MPNWQHGKHIEILCQCVPYLIKRKKNPIKSPSLSFMISGFGLEKIKFYNIDLTMHF